MELTSGCSWSESTPVRDEEPEAEGFMLSLSRATFHEAGRWENDENTKLLIWVLGPLTIFPPTSPMKRKEWLSSLGVWYLPSAGNRAQCRPGKAGTAFLDSQNLMACCVCAVMATSVTVTRVEHSRFLAQLN